MKMKKALALALSATMTMGVAMPVMAADSQAVTAPIYSFEVLNVVVPTTYEVAFNPEGLAVETGGSTPSTDQILSRNYGMINKGNKDQVMTVALKVEDQNTGDNQVTFVNSADEVTNAADNEYKIYLKAVPADSTEVQVGATPAPADKDTAATDLNNVTMTKAADSAAVSLKSGDNKLAFKLTKAKYDPKTGDELTLGTGTTNDVSSNFEISALADGGAGITAFTFDGAMNNKANWSKLTSGIKITATYSNAIAPSSVTTVAGTGAMIKTGPEVTVSATGLVTISGLTADANFVGLKIQNPNGTFDADADQVTWDRTGYVEATGGTITCQLGTGWVSSLTGKSGKAIVTLTNNQTIEAAISIPASNP
ncbi:MAG: hypothetical protein HFG97_01240 [Dorea sp.]|nr:hypothetical protein [Dorea sp.]